MAGVQPKGRALPSLISGDPQSTEEHFALARGVNPLMMLLGASFPKETHATTQRRVDTPDQVISHRLKERAYLHNLAATLTPQREEWATMLGEDSPVNGIHFPLVVFWPVS